MKEVISYEFAKYLGLLPTGYSAINAYHGNYLFESDSQAKLRRKSVDINMNRAYEEAKKLPNLIDKKLMLFEFERDEIMEQIASKG